MMNYFWWILIIFEFFKIFFAEKIPLSLKLYIPLFFWCPFACLHSLTRRDLVLIPRHSRSHTWQNCFLSKSKTTSRPKALHNQVSRMLNPSLRNYSNLVGVHLRLDLHTRMRNTICFSLTRKNFTSSKGLAGVKLFA